jgi:CheY-like chemotaxis protein
LICKLFKNSQQVMNNAASFHVPVQAPRKSSHMKRVLVVDDEALFTELVSATLDRRGEYVTKAVNDPREAISTAREFQPDVILLDVMMPEMDGGDVSRAIEADPILRSVPVIMLTALICEDEVSEDCVATIHNRPALPKPLTADKLVRSIEQSLIGEL